MENKIKNINWQQIQAVIFDVDGTLYNHRKLKLLMFIEMVRNLVKDPQFFYDIKIINHFRKEREKNSQKNIIGIDKAQYQWAATASGFDVERVKTVVNRWMVQMPLIHIYKCRYKGIDDLINCLHNLGIKTVIFSDYPAKEKLSALKLNPQYIFCSTDRNIDRFKPDPTGLYKISESLNIPIKNCLFIGDRYDKDAECASRAGMSYIIIDKTSKAEKIYSLLYDQVVQQQSLTERIFVSEG